MRIFVAGATGALGTQLVPRLAGAGHEVTGMTRTAAKRQALRDLGARPVVADALDARAVAAAVAAAEPEVVMHQLTALSGPVGGRRMDRWLAQTNRLRTEGTDNLLAAARAAGARRVIAQSYAGSGMPFARAGGPVKDEDDPIDPDPPAQMRPALDALRHLEAAVTGIDWGEGLALRYGGFYGPGTGLSAAPDAPMSAAVRARRVPVVGGGGGIWSWVHIADAAQATVAALTRGGPGVYLVVDDEPAPVREWLPALAQALHAPRPRRVPRWVGRLAAGEAMAVMMTETRGASNAKARRELGWAPRFPTWREGFATGLAA